MGKMTQAKLEKKYLISMDEILHKKLRRIALEEDINMKDFILEAIEEKLDREKDLYPYIDKY